jgi:hypothetical protein
MKGAPAMGSLIFAALIGAVFLANLIVLVAEDS